MKIEIKRTIIKNNSTGTLVGFRGNVCLKDKIIGINNAIIYRGEEDVGLALVGLTLLNRINRISVIYQRPNQLTVFLLLLTSTNCVCTRLLVFEGIL